ncbi:hypothetical protein CRYUN_Cryun03dG0175600 [Craigia yunnanensis]
MMLRCYKYTKLNRKLVHISIGLVFMLCWPLFSSGYGGAIFAAITSGINIIRMLAIGSGIWKDEATMKSMSRYGDYRELLKGPLYYATTITLACALYWRTSPIAIAAICNPCAGDGFADVVGWRFGGQKLPYNRNKSIAGSVAMATDGFFTSVGPVESLPISTKIDDNLSYINVNIGWQAFSDSRITVTCKAHMAEDKYIKRTNDKLTATEPEASDSGLLPHLSRGTKRMYAKKRAKTRTTTSNQISPCKAKCLSCENASSAGG